MNMPDIKRNVKVLIEKKDHYITFSIVDFCTNEIVETDGIDSYCMSADEVLLWIMDGDIAAKRIANGGAIIYGGKNATRS